jgi:hypothetical protein
VLVGALEDFSRAIAVQPDLRQQYFALTRLGSLTSIIEVISWKLGVRSWFWQIMPGPLEKRLFERPHFFLDSAYFFLQTFQLLLQ